MTQPTGAQGQPQQPPAGAQQPQPGSLFSGQVPPGPQGMGQGYPGTQQQMQPVAPKRPNPLARLGPETLLPLAVLVLALISYIVSFIGTGGAMFEVYLLLAGGLLSGMSAAPHAPSGALPVGSVLSVMGGLGMLASIVRSGSGDISAILILVFGVLQLLAAVAAYLMRAGLLKLPPPGGGAAQQQPGNWGPGPNAQAQQQSAQFANQQTVMTPQPQQPPYQTGQQGSTDLFNSGGR